MSNANSQKIDSIPTPTAAEILTTLQQTPSWEQRYRYVLELAKQVPDDAVARLQTFAVSGCEAPVWLQVEQTPENTLRYHADSSSRLIRGLLVILLAPVQNQSPSYILTFNFHEWLQSCGLQQQLTPSRTNGLYHICQHAKATAKSFI